MNTDFSIINRGVLAGPSGGMDGFESYRSSGLVLLENYGQINGSLDTNGVFITTYSASYAPSSFDEIINRESGVISGSSGFNLVKTDGGRLINYGLIQGRALYGVRIDGQRTDQYLQELVNYGDIVAGGDGIESARNAIWINEYSIANFHNYGVISARSTADGDARSAAGVFIQEGGNIDTLINQGVIEVSEADRPGQTIDIEVDVSYGGGRIGTFENSQRGVDLYSGSDRLVLGGILPESYNIIINSNSDYGQLNFSEIPRNDERDVSGATTFGISALSDRFSATSFEAVMTGVSSENFNNTTGTYFGADWNLEEQTQRTGVWDLLFQRTPLFDTHRSLEDMRDDTTGIMYNAALSVRSGLEIECTQFGEQGFCLRVGGRVDSSSSNDRVHTSFASLAGAFQINDTFRIGGYVDQQVAHTFTDGFDYQSTAPTLGAFLEYGNVDGSGVQVRVAASRASGELTTTRGLSLTDTEYGRGESDITASGVHGRIGYGLAMENGTIVTPYVGLWRVGVERGAYREGLEPNVRYPFSYDAYEMTKTATVLGMTIDGDLQQGVSFRGDFGLETGGGLDTNAFSGSSNLTEVSEFSFDALESGNDTRFFAGASLNFMVNETADFEVGAMVREAAYANDINVSTRASFIFRF